MPRFFAELDPQGTARITGRDVRHIVRSLRKGPGDELPIRDLHAGYLGRIVSIQPREIILEILSREGLNERSSRIIHLGMSLIDLKEMDDCIRAVTELGVSEIHPVVARRSNIRDVGDKRLDRWRQIIFEAMKQCERQRAPVLHKPLPLGEFLDKTAAAWPCRLVASLSSDSSLQGCTAHEAGILIGPEGGFSPEETEKIHASGFVPVHMGKTILRSCTAAVTAAAILAM